METAQEKLVDFMREMKSWEDKFLKLYQEPDGAMKHIDDARSELKIIQEKYLTKKDRKNGKLAAPSAGYPPEFDPDLENIIKVDNSNLKKIVIETLWNHPQDTESTRKQRYTLVQNKEKILIDKKEVYRSFSQKWESHGF